MWVANVTLQQLDEKPGWQSIPTEPFYMHCKISSLLPPNHMRTFVNGCSDCASTTTGWLFRKCLKVQNLVWQTWRAMKLNTVHAKILEWMSLANRYLQWRVLPTGGKDDFFNIFCFTHVFVWIDLSEIKHNYFNMIQWALWEITSLQPETVLIRC